MEEYCIVDWSALLLCVWKSLSVSPLSENFPCFTRFWQSKMWSNDLLDNRSEGGEVQQFFFENYLFSTILKQHQNRIMASTNVGYSIFFNVEVGSQVLLEHDSIQLPLLCRFSPVRRNLHKIPVGLLFVKGFLTSMCHECIQGDWSLEKVSFSGHYKQDRILPGKWRHICGKYFLTLNGMKTLYQKSNPKTCVGLVHILQFHF